MTARPLGSLLSPALAALVLAVLTAGGCSATSTNKQGSPPAPASSATAPARSYAVPLPTPLLLAQGVSSANPAHRFRSQSWDFARMRAVFDAVSLLPGDEATVQRARRAGLAVVLEFDYKADFFSGKDISRKVQAVVNQVRSNPGVISAIHVADRLDQGHNVQQGLRYLAATGGVFHRELPGVPVLVNVADRQLTCGLPTQSSCRTTDPRFVTETNATLDAFRRSGYVNGFTLADNLKNNNVAAQVAAWRTARARWPRPFILWSTCSQLSFPDARQPGGPQAGCRAGGGLHDRAGTRRGGRAGPVGLAPALPGRHLHLPRQEREQQRPMARHGRCLRIARAGAGRTASRVRREPALCG